MAKKSNKTKGPEQPKRTGRVRRVFTREQLLEMLSSTIGDGKVAIKSEKQAKDDNGRTVTRICWEDGGKIDCANFTTKKEADDFKEAFAGKNLTTVRSDPKYMYANGSWSAEDLHKLGQLVVGCKIALIHNKQLGIETCVLPRGTGRPSINRRKREPKKAEVIDAPQFIMGKAFVTRYFDAPDEFDTFLETLFSKWPDHEKSVQSLRTRHIESGVYVDWKKQQVRDGSDRMEMVVQKVNGKDYGFVSADVIFDVTEGFDVEPCEKLVPPPKQPKPVPVCRVFVEANIEE